MKESNIRVVKNTLFLYIRSFLMMGVSLFSSRVVLQVLGVSDYGLYGAIGSTVAMFTIINNVLAIGSSRFLTFELGKGEISQLTKTFSASFIMHTSLAIFLFLLMETVGLWFVNNKMNIPEERLFAANIVYQLSILVCMLNLTQVPYRASIISHERMNIYAYVGILEVLFKLCLIYLLLYVPFRDNLIAYAIILAVWSIALQLWYRYYCKKHFIECKLHIERDRSIYKRLLSYSLWDFIGQFCYTGNSQGINILINMFFGVIINASRAVAYQVENAILQFSNNFMTAVQPQIVKSFASGDTDRFFQLIRESCRYSFYLLFIVSLPVILEAEYILSLWLVEVPTYAALFLRCIICITLYNSFRDPIIKGVHATGNIKFMNLTSSLYSALTFLPVVYILYYLKFPVWVCFVVQGFNVLVCSWFELWSLKREIIFSIINFYSCIILRTIMVSLVCAIVPMLVIGWLEPSFLRLCVTIVVCVLSSCLIIFYWGMDKSLRNNVILLFKSKLHF